MVICIDHAHVSIRNDIGMIGHIFNFQGFDKPIPARIMMIIDLLDCDIIHDIDQDPDTIPDDADKKIYHI